MRVTLTLLHLKGATHLVITRNTSNNLVTIGFYHLTPPEKDLDMRQPL